MPELPDVEAYLAALRPRVLGARLERVRLANPFILRSVDPPPSALAGRAVTGLRRLGKRVVIALEDDLFVVLHLMIAGRLHWKAPGALPRARTTLAGFRFDDGLLLLTEAGSRRRASLSVIRGSEALRALDPGGVDVLRADIETYAAALRRENHTLKRALTDPRLFDGIGNAYSDEILWAAKLAPLRRRSSLTSDEVDRLYAAMRSVLADAKARLETLVPPHIELQHREFLHVHLRGGEPCPRCGKELRQIGGDEATTFCRTCQPPF